MKEITLGNGLNTNATLRSSTSLRSTRINDEYLEDELLN
jgi:hypothetical protein